MYFGHKMALLTWSNVIWDFYAGIKWGSLLTWVKPGHLRLSCKNKTVLNFHIQISNWVQSEHLQIKAVACPDVFQILGSNMKIILSAVPQ